MMLSTRECRLRIPHRCARPLSAFFRDRSLTLCLITTNVGIKHTENYTLSARCLVFSFPTHAEIGSPSRRGKGLFIPAFQCPHRVQRVGTLGDGGKWVCGLDRVVKQDKCVIYSFGASRFVFVSSSFFAPRWGLNFFSSQNRRYQRRVLVRVDTIGTWTDL